MLIISTRPVAEIIHAVSAASILAGCAAACAKAAVASSVIQSATPERAPQRATACFNIVPLPENFCF